MMLGAKRAKYYSPLDLWGPILKTPGVRFVNLQYGDCADELARAPRNCTASTSRSSTASISTTTSTAPRRFPPPLDLVISAPTAAAASAGSVGTEVWFLTAGRTWPQLGTDEFPWYRKSHVFSPEKFGDWNELMPRVAETALRRLSPRAELLLLLLLLLVVEPFRHRRRRRRRTHRPGDAQEIFVPHRRLGRLDRDRDGKFAFARPP